MVHDDRLIFCLLAGLAVGATLAAPGSYAACAGEDRRARTTALQINEQWPLRPSNDALSDEISRIGRRLGAYAGEPSVNWRYRMVRNYAPYAYAIGGGRIYVSDGLVRLVHSEAELAAAIAHEMGHQIAGHFCSRPSVGTRSINPGLSDMSNKERAVRHLALGVGTLVMDVKKEQEADAIGTDILKASGYEARAMLDLVRRLANETESSSEQNQARIRALEGRLGQQALPESARHRDSGEFTRLQRLLQSER